MCDGGTYYSKSAETGADTIYTALFNAIGTLYGTGDLANTFKVPDLRKKFIQGSTEESGLTSGSVLEAGLPDHDHKYTEASHTHSFSSGTFNEINGSIGTNNNYSNSSADGVFSYEYSSPRKKAGSLDGTGVKFTFKATPSYKSGYEPSVNNATETGTVNNASIQNDVYGKSTTVQPASICINYVIKY